MIQSTYPMIRLQDCVGICTYSYHHCFARIRHLVLFHWRWIDLSFVVFFSSYRHRLSMRAVISNAYGIDCGNRKMSRKWNPHQVMRTTRKVVQSDRNYLR